MPRGRGTARKASTGTTETGNQPPVNGLQDKGSLYLFFLTLTSSDTDCTFAENDASLRRSDCAQKGKGGHLERLQVVSDVVQQTSTRKRKTGQLDIPDAVPANPMAPKPKTKKRRTANVSAAQPLRAG